MIIHLFLESDGDDSHRMFKVLKEGTDMPPDLKDGADTETLYIWPDGVGFFNTSSLRVFKIIPIHRVREIQVTREAGQGWD